MCIESNDDFNCLKDDDSEMPLGSEFQRRADLKKKRFQHCLLSDAVEAADSTHSVRYLETMQTDCI